MLKRSLPLLLLGLFALGATGLAQQPTGPANQRLVHPIKYAKATDLAELLDKLFNSKEVQILADAPSNSLLINAPPALAQEIVTHVGQLDKQPRQVVVEVILAEVVSPRDKDGKPLSIGPDLDAKEFKGPDDVVLLKVAAYQKKGRLTGVKHIYLQALENQPAKTLQGMTLPSSAGAAGMKGGGKGKGGGGFDPTGGGNRIQYDNVGTSAQVTARIPDGKTILLDLAIEDSRQRMPSDAPIVGQDDKGNPVRASEHVSTTSKTRLTLASGDAVAVEGVRTQSASGELQMLVIVMARIADDRGKTK